MSFEGGLNKIFCKVILKFWKKKPEFDEKTIETNANLTTKFTECFKNKNSFNTLKPEIFLEKVDSNVQKKANHAFRFPLNFKRK